MVTKIIIGFGLLSCLVGIIVMLAFEKRDLGGALFQIGFYILALGAVLSVLITKSEDVPHNLGFSLKIVASGFGVIIVGYIANNFIRTEFEIGTYGFYLGLLIMLFGILQGFLKYKNY